MRVAVCDDDRNWLQTADGIIREYADDRGLSIDIVLAERPEELCGEALNSLDIVFMDIEFENGAEGIEYAAKINDQAPDCRIVYLTNYLHYAVDVYDTDHIWFVIKDQFADRLPAVMDRYRRDAEDGRAGIVISLKGGSDVVSLRCADILYIERQPHSSLVVTEDDRMMAKEMYSQLIGRVPKHSFARCHSSISVNMSRIRRIHDMSVIMDNGDELPVSRRYSRPFRQAFMEWAAY